MNALSSWLWRTTTGTRALMAIGKSPATLTRTQFPISVSEGQGLLNPPTPLITNSVRTVISFSMLTGKKKTCHTVISRFFRLSWGAWIRPKSGRHRKVYLKNPSMKKHAREHVFCRGNQSRMFDKMVTKCWRKPTYYVDDPYESYHKRENFYITKGMVK